MARRKKVRQSEAEIVEKRLTQYSPTKPKNRMAKSGMIILEAKRAEKSDADGQKSN